MAANWLQRRNGPRDSGLEGITRTIAARWLRAQVNLSDKVRDPETNKIITRKWFCEKYPDKCKQQTPSRPTGPQGYRGEPQEDAELRARIENLLDYNNDSVKDRAGNVYTTYRRRRPDIKNFPDAERSTFLGGTVDGGRYKDVVFRESYGDQGTDLNNVEIRGGNWSGVKLDASNGPAMVLRRPYNEEAREALKNVRDTMSDDYSYATMINFMGNHMETMKRWFGLGKDLEFKDIEKKVKREAKSADRWAKIYFGENEYGQTISPERGRRSESHARWLRSIDFDKLREVSEKHPEDWEVLFNHARSEAERVQEFWKKEREEAKRRKKEWKKKWKKNSSDLCRDSPRRL